MLDNCGDSVGFPEADVDAPCVDQGRLAGLFLRLHAQRFTGLAYVTAQSRTTTFAFRDGTPVMVEASTPEASLADELVERDLLSHDQYAEVIGRVTEELVENEEVAFCQHAVELGYLSEEQVRAELTERARARLIQALSLVGCEVEFDDSEDVLLGIVEYPQQLGAAIYMGVRTFYEEELLQSFVPDLTRHYLRLTKAPAEIARFFELDYEEVALLNSIDPQVRAATWFDASDLEPSHALQLVALLVIARMCESGTSAFVPPEAERSGVRSAARAEPMRSPSRGSMNAVHEREGARGGSRGVMPAVREEMGTPRAGARAVPAGRVRGESRPVNDPRAEVASPIEPRSQVARNEGSGAYGGMQRDSAPQPVAAGARRVESSPQVPPANAPVVDAAAEALAEARARVARDGRRGGSYAAQRLGRQIEAKRAAAAPKQEATAPAPPTHAPQPSTPARAPAQPAAAPPPTAANSPEYQKAHLKELWKRRTNSQTNQPAVRPREAVRDLRHGQELLRDGQYARAEEYLRALVEQNPANDTFRAYHAWSQMRAGMHLDASQLSGLRDLVKKLVSDEEHAGFACYVLGHLYLADKKDEQAEKFFRKAHTIDKSNKDAERHVVILERRKQQASEADAGGQRKLFGISLGKKGE